MIFAEGVVLSDSTDRTFAINFYNRAQDLLYSARSPEQDQELLQAALMSRKYWRLVGGEQEFAISDWLMSRVYALFNQSEKSIEFALGALSHNQTGFPAWLKASLLEGAARAYQSANNFDEFNRYKELALNELANEADLDDRNLIAEQIAQL